MPIAKGASKMVFNVKKVNADAKERLESENDTLIMKRNTAMNTWKIKNAAAIKKKLSEITDLDEQLKFMKDLDSIADKMDGTEYCYFETSYAPDNNHKNKVIVQIPITNGTVSLDDLHKEIKLQHTLSEQNMMPEIYAVQVFVKMDESTYAYMDDPIDVFLSHDNFENYIDNKDATVICVYLLEEKCDAYEPHHITLQQSKNYVKKVFELAKATAELGYYNTDFKHGNECPSTEDADGELHLTRMRALDIEPRRLIKIDESIMQNAAILMFLSYLLHFNTHRNYYFKNNPEVFEKILEHGRNELNEIGYVNPNDFIDLVESFLEKYPKILLASYVIATGDVKTVEDIQKRKIVPTLLIRFIFMICNPRQPNASGNKRKSE